MATVGARFQGAGILLAVENVPRRRELAKQFGADTVIDFTEVDPVEEILRLTDGQGVDASIECLGEQVTFEEDGIIKPLIAFD